MITTMTLFTQFIKDGTLIVLPTICGYALSATLKNKEENSQVEVISFLNVSVNRPEETLYSSEYKTPQKTPNISVPRTLKTAAQKTSEPAT